MLALSLTWVDRLILLAHLLILVATLATAGSIAAISAPLLILLITSSLIVILVRSFGATFVSTSPLPFHRHAHTHTHAHVAAETAPTKTWERHTSLLQGRLHMLRIQLTAD